MDIFQQIQKSQLEDILHKANVLGDEETIQKAFSAIIEKGGVAQIGEVREWKGGKFKKTPQGWIPITESKEGSKIELKEGDTFYHRGGNWKVEKLDNKISGIRGLDGDVKGFYKMIDNSKILGFIESDKKKKENKRKPKEEKVNPIRNVKVGDSLFDDNGFEFKVFKIAEREPYSGLILKDEKGVTNYYNWKKVEREFSLNYKT